MCSDRNDRGKCCRYINAFVAVSIAQYANATSNLGVPLDLSDICLHSISQTMELYGVPRNATAFCGFGTKIPVNYDCRGRTTVTQMLQSPQFANVTENCKLPLSRETDCRKCINAGMLYLHHVVGAEDNMTLSTCRDATFAALASQLDNVSAIEIASCFFQVRRLNIPPGLHNFERKWGILISDEVVCMCSSNYLCFPSFNFGLLSESIFDIWCLESLHKKSYSVF